MLQEGGTGMQPEGAEVFADQVTYGLAGLMKCLINISVEMGSSWKVGRHWYSGALLRKKAPCCWGGAGGRPEPRSRAAPGSDRSAEGDIGDF